MYNKWQKQEKRRQETRRRHQRKQARTVTCSHQQAADGVKTCTGCKQHGKCGLRRLVLNVAGTI